MTKKSSSGFQYYQGLAHKLMQGVISEEERIELEDWYNRDQDKPVHIPASVASNESEHARRILKGIRKKAGIGGHKEQRRILKWAAAAAIVSIMAGSSYLFRNFFKSNTTVEIAATGATDSRISPGTNKAVLTLEDGSDIILNSTNTGMTIRQGNVNVIRVNDNQISYRAKSNAMTTTKILYNTVTTPRGGQYQLVLEDGTKVWLNSQSSLRFPTAFRGTERKVELTGEGYFEVAHDIKRPFYVKTDNLNVNVLGTHFNLNSYADEDAVKVTLLEGKVEVMSSDRSVVLQPGEQAILERGKSALHNTPDVDLDQAVAWKNGYFSFDNASLKEIMQQLSRWYNVEVEYESEIPSRKFGGVIPRSLELNVVLKILEESNVHFKIEGKKLIVSP